MPRAACVLGRADHAPWTALAGRRRAAQRRQGGGIRKAGVTAAESSAASESAAGAGAIIDRRRRSKPAAAGHLLRLLWRRLVRLFGRRGGSSIYLIVVTRSSSFYDGVDRKPDDHNRPDATRQSQARLSMTTSLVPVNPLLLVIVGHSKRFHLQFLAGPKIPGTIIRPADQARRQGKIPSISVLPTPGKRMRRSSPLFALSKPRPARIVRNAQTRDSATMHKPYPPTHSKCPQSRAASFRRGPFNEQALPQSNALSVQGGFTAAQCPMQAVRMRAKSRC